jgi:hypothetical protein
MYTKRISLIAQVLFILLLFRVFVSCGDNAHVYTLCNLCPYR